MIINFLWYDRIYGLVMDTKQTHISSYALVENISYEFCHRLTTKISCLARGTVKRNPSPFLQQQIIGILFKVR